MDAIKKIKTKLEEYKNQQEKNELLSDVGIHIVTKVIDEAIKIVDKVAAEEGNNDGWIPVSERLPDRYCHCLVTRRNDYEDGSFDSDVREDVYIELEGVWDWQSKFEGLIDDIIAWQPLPQQYMPHERKE